MRFLFRLPPALLLGILICATPATTRNASAADTDDLPAATGAAPAQPEKSRPERSRNEGVRLDGAAQRRAGIVTASPQPAPRPEIRAYGSVLDLAGLIELAEDAEAAEAQLRAARAKVEASRGSFERARRLFQDQQHVLAPQIQSTEAAYLTDEAALAAAEAQRRTVEAKAVQEWGPVLAAALTGGGDSVRRLMARQDLLVQITLPPGTVLPAAPAAGSVEVPGRGRAKLRYVSIAPRADPRLQGMSYFYAAPSDSGLLPRMNLLAFLPAPASSKLENAGIVPETAVVRWQGKDWIYLRDAPEHFVRRAIPTDRKLPEGGYFVPGLAADAQLVVTGTQLLLSEEFKAPAETGDQD
jgi:hypothetical protein